MTARNHAMMNLVADALVARLELIGNSNDSAWLSSPKTVSRGIAVDFANLPKPGLFLMAQTWGPSVPSSRGTTANLQARTEARFLVLAIVDTPITNRETEQQLNDLAADVIVAIENDYQLGDLLGTGWVHVVSYSLEVELARAGFAVASVELSAEWQWDTDSP
jgi:hypothetical protein